MSKYHRFYGFKVLRIFKLSSSAISNSRVFAYSKCFVTKIFYETALKSTCWCGCGVGGVGPSRVGELYIVLAPPKMYIGLVAPAYRNLNKRRNKNIMFKPRKKLGRYAKRSPCSRSLCSASSREYNIIIVRTQSRRERNTATSFEFGQTLPASRHVLYFRERTCSRRRPGINYVNLGPGWMSMS